MNALHVTLAEKQAVLGLVEGIKKVMDLLLMKKEDAVRSVYAPSGNLKEILDIIQ